MSLISLSNDCLHQSLIGVIGHSNNTSCWSWKAQFFFIFMACLTSYLVISHSPIPFTWLIGIIFHYGLEILAFQFIWTLCLRPVRTAGLNLFVFFHRVLHFRVKNSCGPVLRPDRFGPILLPENRYGSILLPENRCGPLLLPEDRCGPLSWPENRCGKV